MSPQLMAFSSAIFNLETSIIRKKRSCRRYNVYNKMQWVFEFELMVLEDDQEKILVLRAPLCLFFDPSGLTKL